MIGDNSRKGTVVKMGRWRGIKASPDWKERTYEKFTIVCLTHLLSVHASYWRIYIYIYIYISRTTVKQDVQTRFSLQLAFAKFQYKIKEFF